MKKQLLFILLIFVSYTGSSQTPGELNPNYGANGVVTKFLKEIRFTTYDAAYENYMITVLGQFNDFNRDLEVVLRFNNNGTLDQNFGINGMVVVNDVDIANGLTAQYLDAFPDGSFVVGIQDQANNPQIVKYNPQGKLDTSFGVNGTTTIDLAEDVRLALSPIAFPTNYKIVVPLNRRGGGGSYLLKLTANGEFDPTFSDDGLTDQLVGSISSVDKQTFNGVGGYAVVHKPSGIRNWKLSIIEHTGDLFSGPFDIGERAAIYSPNGIMVGYGGTLRRYNTNLGDYDMSYGDFGRFNSGFSIFRSSINSIQDNFLDYANGEILYYGSDNRWNDFHFRKVGPNGGLVNTFSPDGVSEPFDFLGHQDFLVKGFKMDNAEVLGVGYSSTADFYDSTSGYTFTLTMIRLQSNTQPDPNFGNRSGRYILEPKHKIIKSILTKRSGGSTPYPFPVIAVSEQPLTGYKYIQAVNPSVGGIGNIGEIATTLVDLELNHGAYYQDNSGSASSDEHLIGVGVINTNGDNDFMLARLTENINGAFTRIDFGGSINDIVQTDINNGSNDIASSVTAMEDNGQTKLVVAGTSDSEFVIARYLGQGTNAGLLDTGFGTNGIVRPTISGGRFVPSKIKTGNDGNIYVSGELINGTSRTFALKKFNPNGVEDTNFLASDIYTASSNNAMDFIIYDDGSFLVLGNENISGNRVKVRKYNSDGTPDNSFGTNSYLYLGLANANLSAYEIQYLAGNKFAVVGTSGTNGFVAVFDDTGTMDASFANNGILEQSFGLNDVELNSVQLVDSSKLLVSGTGIENGNRVSLSSEIFVDTSITEYTEIPNPIFEQYLIDQGIDTNPTIDGRVPTASINTVTTLDISDYNISSFAGIQDFTALEDFSLINDQAASLPQINFSGNPNLVRLSIINAPQLSGVDISTNNLLEDITLVPRGTQFTSLDLTGKQNVTSLLLADSGISNLDLSSVPNLTYLGVQLNESLSNIDVSSLTALEILETYGSGLTTIDISNNPNMTRLSAYNSYNGALTEANVQNGFNGSITSLQLENNPNLSCIQVDASIVGTSPTGWVKDNMASYQANCTSEYTLIPDTVFEQYLVDQGIDATPNDGRVLTSALVGVTNVNVERLFINSMEGIQDFVDLEVLNVNQINLGTIDLSQNLQLRELYANACSLNALNLVNNVALEVLEVFGNGIVDLNLEFNTRLQRVDVSSNPLASLFLLNHPDLSSLNVSDTGIRFLAIEGTQLTSLDLSTNDFLENLSLRFNTISNLVLPADDSPLTSMEVAGEDLTIFAVENRSNLEDLTIFDIRATDLIVENLPKLTSFQLDENILLKTLRVAGTSLGTFNGLQLNNRALVNVEIEGNPNLQNLPLSVFLRDLERLSVVDNDLTSLDITNLTTLETLSVRNNPNLTTLDLTSLQDGGTSSSLSTYEGENTGITSLDFSACPNIDRIFLAYNGTNGGVPLTSLNLKNGNNGNISDVIITGNFPDLSCVEVDGATVGNVSSTWQYDAGTQFLEDCSAAPNQVSVAFLVSSESMLEDLAFPNPQLVLNGTVTIPTTIQITDVTSNASFSNPAVAGSDYEFNNGQPLTIQIPAQTYDGNNPIPVPGLVILADTEIEGNESIVLEVTSNSTELPLVPGDLSFTYTYNVIEDDFRIEVAAGNNIDENGIPSVFTISLTDGNGNALTNTSGQDIQLNWLDIGTAQQGTDFSLSGNRIIPNGQSSTEISISAIDDMIFEGLESVGLEIQEGDGYFVDINGLLPSAQLGIADNDNHIILTKIQDGAEGLQDAIFALGLGDDNGNSATNGTQNSLGFDVSLSESASGTSAELGTDFINGLKNQIGNTVFIEPGQSSATFEIEIIDDTVEEEVETFIVEITTNESDITIPVSQVKGQIIDNNAANGSDSDNDGVLDVVDNCPNTANADQADLDGDGIGDLCDTDDDGDGIPDTEDAFPRDDSEDTDTDGDGTGNNADLDDDNDGVPDSMDNCPLEAGISNENGCPETGLDIGLEDISVLVLSETCPDRSNGSFEVSVDNEQYTFEVSLDGNPVGTANFSNDYVATNLAQGSYQVCITTGELPDFERCFGVEIKTYDRISATTQGIDSRNLKARFIVDGSKEYEVYVNQKQYSFSMESTGKEILTVPVEKGKNEISISGSSDCQGIYAEIIQIGDISIYPNPVVDILNFQGFTSDEKGRLNIYSLSGQMVKQVELEIISGKASIDLSTLPSGVYLIQSNSLDAIKSFKIVKE
ncbi:MAG: thrombospondin type 3 repeat-containing protein [Muricauda sp.]|nr:thrombospondin type 3 repeat-containing protein [Allomuricauda sp.]MBA4746869.1 thrombospondin type 3 repeat-containing protein [Allomuricauda sp.]